MGTSTCRHENGVWGVKGPKIKDLINIKVKADKKVNTSIVLSYINKILEEVAPIHLEILINRKDICSALGDWAYKWMNKFQRNTNGIQPAQWEMYSSILMKVKQRLSAITMFTLNTLQEEKNVDTEGVEVDEIQEAKIGIHNKEMILPPNKVSEYIKKKNVKQWRVEWAEKEKQGVVGRCSGEQIVHTTYFINSPNLDVDTKYKFMKLSVGGMYTKNDRKRWRYIEDDTCNMCRENTETIRHVLSGCKELKYMYIARHNAC
jgi:hypothetical protein